MGVLVLRGRQCAPTVLKLRHWLGIKFRHPSSLHKKSIAFVQPFEVSHGLVGQYSMYVVTRPERLHTPFMPRSVQARVPQEKFVLPPSTAQCAWLLHGGTCGAILHFNTAAGSVHQPF
jgi:hypothetical protein